MPRTATPHQPTPAENAGRTLATTATRTTAQPDGLRLLLVRHGESRASAAGVMSGTRSCAGLTDQGRRQARLLAERLTTEENPPDAIIASPVPRARETADILTTGLDLGTPTTEAGVREMDFGAADGLTVHQYTARHGTFDLQAQPKRPFAPGGESWSQMCARVGETLERIAAHPPGRRVLVVCHAGVIAASAALAHSPPKETLSDSSPAPTSLNEFAPTTDNAPAPWQLLRYDDHRHITKHATPH